MSLKYEACPAMPSNGTEMDTHVHYRNVRTYDNTTTLNFVTLRRNEDCESAKHCQQLFVVKPHVHNKLGGNKHTYKKNKKNKMYIYIYI